MIDGFYLGYMSAVGGYSVVLFVFKDNVIVGADAGGVKFDGAYTLNPDSGSYNGSIKVTAPANITLVQGKTTGEDGLTYNVNFSMPENFLNQPFITIATPYGSVNVKLEKIRDMGNMK